MCFAEHVMRRSTKLVVSFVTSCEFNALYLIIRPGAGPRIYVWLCGYSFSEFAEPDSHACWTFVHKVFWCFFCVREMFTAWWSKVVIVGPKLEVRQMALSCKDPGEPSELGTWHPGKVIFRNSNLSSNEDAHPTDEQPDGSSPWKSISLVIVALKF